MQSTFAGITVRSVSRRQVSVVMFLMKHGRGLGKIYNGNVSLFGGRNHPVVPVSSTHCKCGDVLEIVAAKSKILFADDRCRFSVLAKVSEIGGECFGL